LYVIKVGKKEGNHISSFVSFVNGVLRVPVFGYILFVWWGFDSAMSDVPRVLPPERVLLSLWRQLVSWADSHICSSHLYAALLFI
jgi:hypothetical protein